MISFCNCLLVCKRMSVSVGSQDVLVSSVVNKVRSEHVFRRFTLLSQHISATTEINI